METITWEDFQKVELRIGKIIEVKDFPTAKKPAYQLKIDFGENIGIKKSSAQITTLYTKEALLNKLVLAVTNFKPKQIGNFMSECLVTGFYNDDKAVILAMPDKKVPLGSRLL